MEVPRTTKIAAWAIRTKWNREVARFKYKDKDQAEKCLLRFREKYPDEGYFLQLVKDSIDTLATQIADITTSERVVRGVTEDASGERHFWRKVFVDVFIYARFEGWTSLRVYKKHYFKGDLKIMAPDCEKSMNVDEFEEYAKCTWPACWREVIIFFEN